jgi:hypothetical protein
MNKNKRFPSQEPENHSLPFYSSSSLSSESLPPLFFPSPFLNPEIRSHMTMRTMPMARKLTAPTFRKKSEKYSIVSIFLFSQYHFHQPDVKSNLPQKQYHKLCLSNRLILHLVMLRDKHNYFSNLNNLNHLLTVFVKIMLINCVKHFQG